MNAIEEKDADPKIAIISEDSIRNNTNSKSFYRQRRQIEHSQSRKATAAMLGALQGSLTPSGWVIAVEFVYRLIWN